MPESINYHFMIDDKFIDDFITDAKSVSENNVFIFTFDPPAKHVKSTDGIHATYGSDELDSVVSRITQDDKVFVHWYNRKITAVLGKIPSKTKVYLCFWGGDFLESPFFSHPVNALNEFLFDPLTLKYVKERTLKEHKSVRAGNNKSARNSGNVKNMVATRLMNMKQSAKSITSKAYNEGMQERADFLNRLEGICHWNKFDVHILNDLYKVSLKQHYFVYGAGTNELPAPEDGKTNQNEPLTIWLGNSDTETNNHLDALELLKKFKDENIEIICPLNYGNKTYADYIASRGQKLFGKKFVALLDFIPRDKYYDLMDAVDIVYMPHNRGQAGGNIVAFIKKGKRIFMKEQSSIYQLFTSLGIKLHTASQLGKMSLSELATPLTQDQINENIKSLNSSISDENKRMDALKTLLQ